MKTRAEEKRKIKKKERLRTKRKEVKGKLQEARENMVFTTRKTNMKAAFSQIFTDVFQRISSVFSDRISLLIFLISAMCATCDAYKP
jgi:hypothetical protein